MREWSSTDERWALHCRMQVFFEALKSARDKHVAAKGSRRWLYVPYDQLNSNFGPLSRESPTSLGIVAVETPWKASRRPYHKQKLGLVLANQRHFVLEQARRGVDVRYLTSTVGYGETLAGVAAELGPLRVMEPAERELRFDIAPLVRDGKLEVIHHEGWLTKPDDFNRSQRKGPPWRMDAFYREVRKRTGILMDEDCKPVGGKYSFDAENRNSWSGEPPAAQPPKFKTDAITREVAELINSKFVHHPGELDISTIPTTVDDAEALWAWALQSCLPMFGPFEDAMSTESTNLFHTRISALLNIHRLLPSQVVEDVVALDVPIASQEGFLRQVIGWREFMRHVHVATDGFRNLPNVDSVSVAKHPGDGGYAAWSGTSWAQVAARSEHGPDGGSRQSVLGAENDVPPAYWGAKSGMLCLDQVVTDVWDEAYSHHITRLMVLANLATLLEVSPRALTDWFWSAYIDAFDWVVEPNVMGMGTFGLGELFTTKPYVSGGAYIKKMSNFCSQCSLKSVCPVTRLYWAFMTRHRDALNDNHRLRMMMASERKRGEAKKSNDATVFEYVTETLARGETLERDTLKSLTRSD